LELNSSGVKERIKAQREILQDAESEIDRTDKGKVL
jgi:hypothetical protein